MRTTREEVQGSLGAMAPAILAFALAGVACAGSAPRPPAPKPAPPATASAPPSVPGLPDRAEARDRARARAATAAERADTARRQQPAPVPPPAPRTTPRATLPATPRAPVTLARPGARTDPIPARTLRAPIRVCSGGDVTLGTNLDPEWARTASEKLRSVYGLRDDPTTLLDPLRPLVADAEVVLVNVESAIGAGPTPTKCGRRSTNCFAFRAPLASAGALRQLHPRGVVVGNLANNHARDAGSAGRDSTIAALVGAGVLVTGVDSAATPVPTRGGDTIGVLGFYTSDSTPDARDTAAVRRLVARAAERYPVVIVTMHLGAEGAGAQRTFDRPERYLGIDRGNPVAFAEAAVGGGAALVVGHGPHVLRAIEWRERGALIAYSLGNLLTYGPFRNREPANRGAVLCTTIDTSGRPRDAELRPTVQLVPGVMERDRSARALALIDSLGRLDFPETSARVGAGGTLRPRAPASSPRR